MERPARLTAVLLAFSALLATAPPVPALPGVARGRVAILDSPGHLHGYSGYSGLWTTIPTAAPAARILASDYLGFSRNSQKIYCYNATNDRWIESPYAGFPLGESIEGATGVFWTNSEVFGISSIWILWKKETVQVGEAVLGGGSAESFGLVWTTRRALAYSASNGQWVPQQLGIRPAGAIARKGLGLVWTNQSAFAFSAATRQWIDLQLDAPSGISATGDGQVGLIWTGGVAQAYAAATDEWYPIEPGDAILGGSAGGQTAIVWTAYGAHVFDASRSLWSSIVFPAAAGTDDGAIGTLRASFLAVAPNPARGHTLGLRLEQPGVWTVALYDVKGARIATRDFEVGPAGSGEIAWDWTADRDPGSAPVAGTYWIRAESAHGVEARRLVILPE